MRAIVWRRSPSGCPRGRLAICSGPRKTPEASMSGWSSGRSGRNSDALRGICTRRAGSRERPWTVGGCGDSQDCSLRAFQVLWKALSSKKGSREPHIGRTAILHHQRASRVLGLPRNFGPDLTALGHRDGDIRGEGSPFAEDGARDKHLGGATARVVLLDALMNCLWAQAFAALWPPNIPLSHRIQFFRDHPGYCPYQSP